MVVAFQLLLLSYLFRYLLSNTFFKKSKRYFFITMEEVNYCNKLFGWFWRWSSRLGMLKIYLSSNKLCNWFIWLLESVLTSVCIDFFKWKPVELTLCNYIQSWGLDRLIILKYQTCFVPGVSRSHCNDRCTWRLLIGAWERKISKFDNWHTVIYFWVIR